tara:strand:+ start:111 stop:371 length:261 start_codon:yes stop_codon:yes gene_type:complete
MFNFQNKLCVFSTSDRELYYVQENPVPCLSPHGQALSDFVSDCNEIAAGTLIIFSIFVFLQNGHFAGSSFLDRISSSNLTQQLLHL